MHLRHGSWFSFPTISSLKTEIPVFSSNPAHTGQPLAVQVSAKALYSRHKSHDFNLTNEASLIGFPIWLAHFCTCHQSGNRSECTVWDGCLKDSWCQPCEIEGRAFTSRTPVADTVRTDSELSCKFGEVSSDLLKQYKVLPDWLLSSKISLLSWDPETLSLFVKTT